MSRHVRTLVLHLEAAEQRSGCPAYFEEEEPTELCDGYRLALPEHAVVRQAPLCWTVRWVDEGDPERKNVEKRNLLSAAESVLRRLQRSVESLRSEEGL